MQTAKLRNPSSQSCLRITWLEIRATGNCRRWEAGHARRRVYFVQRFLNVVCPRLTVSVKYGELVQHSSMTTAVFDDKRNVSERLPPHGILLHHSFGGMPIALSVERTQIPNDRYSISSRRSVAFYAPYAHFNAPLFISFQAGARVIWDTELHGTAWASCYSVLKGHYTGEWFSVLKNESFCRLHTSERPWDGHVRFIAAGGANCNTCLHNYTAVSAGACRDSCVIQGAL